MRRVREQRRTGLRHLPGPRTVSRWLWHPPPPRWQQSNLLHPPRHRGRLPRRGSAGDGGRSARKESQVSGSNANDTEGGVGNRISDARPELPAPPLPRIGERERRRTSSYTTVVEGWVDSARRYKLRVPNWPLDDSLLHRHLSYATLVQYDHWWNSAFLHMAAFAEPLFYLDGPPSANYGGLGVVLARHLYKAYDYAHGTQLDADRNVRFWMSRSSLESFENKLDCVNDSSWMMAHVAAIEIAYAAAFGAGSKRGGQTAAEDGERKSIWLPGQRKAVSPEMVFFLVYCRSTCRSRHGDRLGQLHPRRRRCGEVLKRMASFGRAFKCRRDSPMMSWGPKCSFFGN
ncbi:neprilysin-11-like [Dermacentor andersoni]|uniref:neprilysin-11-like n=1 Tax=Dermacentor andersoni TaxID=34620 RepID=UPI003B3AC386